MPVEHSNTATSWYPHSLSVILPGMYPLFDYNHDDSRPQRPDRRNTAAPRSASNKPRTCPIRLLSSWVARKRLTAECHSLGSEESISRRKSGHKIFKPQGVKWQSWAQRVFAQALPSTRSVNGCDRKAWQWAVASIAAQWPTHSCTTARRQRQPQSVTTKQSLSDAI